MLTQEQEKKVDVACERFRWAAKEAERLFDMPIVVRYSGGKDSDVILQLAKESGVPFRVTHNLTTADPPDNVYYIRRVFAALREEGIEAKINIPKRSLWRIMRETLVIPSRLMRVCCSELKERKMADAPYIVTGVRWAESAGRRAKSGIAMVYNASAPPPHRLATRGGSKRQPPQVSSPRTTPPRGVSLSSAPCVVCVCLTPSLIGRTPTYGITSTPEG